MCRPGKDMKDRMKFDTFSLLASDIKMLPKGTIIRRNIRGIDRFYHQWREDGKTRSHYLNPAEIMPLRTLIEFRKYLERNPITQSTNQLIDESINRQIDKSTKRKIKEFPPPDNAIDESKNRQIEEFPLLDLIEGKLLLEFAYGVGKFKKREDFSKLLMFLREECSDGVLLLSGPVGSGKTTLLRQLILELTPDELAKTVYWHPLANDSPATITAELVRLRSRGCRIALIDDTPPLADIGGTGMKIILAGTAPISHYLSRFTIDESTNRQIDESSQSFNSIDESTNQSIEQSSTKTIPLANRIIPVDLSFTPYREHCRLFGPTSIDVFIRLGGLLHRDSTLNVLRPHELSEEDAEANDLFILEAINSVARTPKEFVPKNERFLLSDMQKQGRYFAAELGEPEDESDDLRDFLLLAPPYLRYRHAEERIAELLRGDALHHFGAAERKLLNEHLMREIRFRLLEDIVWRETDSQRTSAAVSVERIRFAPGAYGLLVVDHSELNCEIRTVSYTDTRTDLALRYLNDPMRLDDLEQRYGFITVREVLYLGRNAHHGSGVMFRNIEDYLMFDQSYTDTNTDSLKTATKKRA